MPLSSSARRMFMRQAMRELSEDNKKKGTARGAGGKIRPRKQRIAIALSKTRKAGY